MKKISFLAICLLFLGGVLFAEGTEKTKTQNEGDGGGEVVGTFHGKTIINLPTVETNRRRTLGFRISHRMGNIFEQNPDGSIKGPDFYNFLGLTGASVLIGLDYGITDRLTVGIDHATVGKMNGAFVKYKILAQTDDNSMPLTLTGFGRANVTSLRHPLRTPQFDPFDNFANRCSYSAQVIAARKFGEGFSLQVAPTFIHYNLVDSASYSNSMFGITAGARIRVLKRLSLSLEYARVLNSHVSDFARQELYSDNLGVSFDIETGGHVFQLFVVNSRGINETQTIPYTRNDWLKGQVRFGFNIYRNFSL